MFEIFGAALVAIGAVLGAIGAAVPGWGETRIKWLRENPQELKNAEFIHDRCSFYGWLTVIAGSVLLFINAIVT